MVEPYLPTVKEVFFSWPGMVSGRNIQLEKSVEESIEQLVADLAWCRKNGVEFDLLFNANCYGEEAFTEILREQVYDVMEELGRRGLFPEIVTTTSQYIAKVLKIRYPQVEIRASVNMKLESTKAMEYISDIFDSFYICRDIQKDRNVLKHFSDWCNAHGKKLCMRSSTAVAFAVAPCRYGVTTTSATSLGRRRSRCSFSIIPTGSADEFRNARTRREKSSA